MPKVDEAGFYSGVVKKVEIDEQYGSLQCTVETEDKRHGYPSLYLANQAGGPNDKSFETLKTVFGWSGQDVDELEKLALGKTIRFRVGMYKEKLRYYFVTPKPMEEKPMKTDDKQKAQGFLSRLRNGGVPPEGSGGEWS